MTDTARQDGWYWTKLIPGIAHWTPIEFKSGKMHTGILAWEFEPVEIGPRIPMPDDPQAPAPAEGGAQCTCDATYDAPCPIHFAWQAPSAAEPTPAPEGREHAHYCPARRLEVDDHRCTCGLTREKPDLRSCRSCGEGTTFTLRIQDDPWTYECGICHTLIGDWPWPGAAQPAPPEQPPVTVQPWRVDETGYAVTDGSNSIEITECSNKQIGYRAGLAKHVAQVLNTPRMTRRQIAEVLVIGCGHNSLASEVDAAIVRLRQLGISVED